jgi:hypothetical protein
VFSWTLLHNYHEQLNNAPNTTVVLPRYRHEIVLLGDRVLVFGGGTRENDCGFESVRSTFVQIYVIYF